MLRHKAYIQAIRYAFGLTAVDDDEAERMDVRIPEYSISGGHSAALEAPARKPAREVPAEQVEQEEDAAEEVTEKEEKPRDGLEEMKRELLADIKAAIVQLSDEDQKAVRKAAGVELFTKDCSIAQLEAAARRASELVEGARE
jgi:hypothetical protein